MPPSAEEIQRARADRRLLAVLDEAFREAAGRAGPWLSCRPGCTECCHGPFPIHRLDAWRLARGLAELAASEPERAAAVAERAREQIPLLAEGFPGDASSGVLDPEEDDDEDDEAADAFFTRHAALPCPALDPATDRCDLYAHRPATCRTFGPPVRLGDASLPPCRLCFRGAPAAEVERCRVEADPHGLEDRLVTRFGEDRETLIAFALAGPS